jgi:flagellar motor switch protein FliM
MCYGDFLASRSNPTCLSILRVEPLGADMCLELSPQIAFPLIDRLLGGRGDLVERSPARVMTQIERGLVLQIIERAAAALADTWSRDAAVTVSEAAVFSEPCDARIMPQDEMVSVVTFSVSFKSSSGSMTLCLPAPVTNMLGTNLAVLPAQRTSTADGRLDTENLTQNVMQSAVELRALLAETKLRLDEVLSLAAGDIITTDTPADGHVALRMRDEDVMLGRIAQIHGNRAIEISTPAGGQHKA